MEQPSIGDKLFIREEGGQWIPFYEAFLSEAKVYEWRIEMTGNPMVIFNGAPLLYKRIDQLITGVFTSPFQAGTVEFRIGHESAISYVYPDSRKITAEQFDIMLQEILQEAPLCFEYAGLSREMNADARSRRISWAQWTYIQNNFQTLMEILRSILEQPQRMLVSQENFVKREAVKQLSAKSLHWLETHYGTDSGQPIPRSVRIWGRVDSHDTYENKVLKRQLIELGHLLGQYMLHGAESIQAKAARYKNQLQYWLHNSFLRDVPPLHGNIKVTTTFRKQPLYSQWYRWFDKLYTHGQEKLGFAYAFPLKQTFELYEIWCYMKLLAIFREKGLLADTSALFETTAVGLFIDLAENKASAVQLTNGMNIYYQRVYHYGTSPFYTFTQRMIPDIVIEYGDRLYILDPKYRIAANVGTALGEMHKYRDGIRLKQTNAQVVQKVFILTPVSAQGDTELRYYKQAEFHAMYSMGAICLAPGKDDTQLRECIDEILLESV